MENSVDTLLQDTALEFVLIDSSEPDMLSDLQPRFEEIYEKSKALQMEELSEKACNALSITGDIIQGRTADIDTGFKHLGDIISEMATVFRDFKGTGPLNTGDDEL
ncbi:MAG: hypothetical protein U9P10_12125 [Thermodesulfobacteriota bacterium]|nr:hypothetical protein [Thermodesulfobacteriota bacterium]